MTTFGWARVAVYYAKEDAYAPYYREAFEHAGLRFEVLEDVSPRELGRVNVLVLCGYGYLDSNRVAAVDEWVKKGGCVICSGSTWKLDSLLGVQSPRHMSNAVLSPIVHDRLWATGVDRARFFGGALAKGGSCEAIAKAGPEFVGITRKKTGKGYAFFFGPHVGQTIALMQLGRSVECDAIGPSDGSAFLDNNILRAEDGAVLDFRDDRATVPGSDVPFFAYPHSDAIREMLIRMIFNAADLKELTLPIVWFWPEAANLTAMLTLDCEKYEREHVEKLYRVLAMFGVPAAWLVGSPGYTVDTYRSMRAWEHEIGFLFMTDDNMGWHEERFKIQHTSMSRLTAEKHLQTFRAVDGKWRGHTKPYEFSDHCLARVSLCKGGRQAGTTGFLFGTCHPFFPMKRDGHSYATEEIPYSVYMPGTVTSDAASENLLNKTADRHGCMHIVFRPEAISDLTSNNSLRKLLSLCKQKRAAFTLPSRQYAFERARRQLRFGQKQIGEDGILHVSSETAIEGLTMLFSGPRLEGDYRGKEMNAFQFQAFGTNFTGLRLNLEAKQQAEISVRTARAQAA